MIISAGRLDAPGTERTGTTFTGQVWGDPVLPETDGVLINTVTFAPGARTDWHTHDGGQVLHVLAGQGRVATRGGETATIRAGDVVFFRPGEEHWHGADDHTFLVHLAISLSGHAWLDPVSDEDYAVAAPGGSA
jgi:quercetin dioxygenase-like cupin family protein